LGAGREAAALHAALAGAAFATITLLNCITGNDGWRALEYARAGATMWEEDANAESNIRTMHD
jgi:hypothetical protein